MPKCPSQWYTEAMSNRGPSRRWSGRLLTVGVCLASGFLLATGAAASRGYDLRGDRNADVASLVAEQAKHNEALEQRAQGLRAEVDQLSRAQVPSIDQARLDAAAEAAGLLAVEGPAVSVSLQDAPLSVKPAGVDPDALVVHQQDIQAVANALWAGGAEAMTIQGQRVVATTAIKCVGNTVVIHGVPYAPPYVVTAIGDQAAMEASLQRDPALKIYRQYVDAYKLGYDVKRLDSVSLPAYKGPLPTNR